MARLLIVDDEQNTRECLRDLVAWREAGISSVRTARNGREALELATQEPPDVLLTDVRMPKMDGIELATRVRELWPHCKIVFLSGYADKEYLKTAIQLQAVSYIEKPIDPAEVCSVVATAVARQREELRELADLQQARDALALSVRLRRQQLAAALVNPGADPAELRVRFGGDLPCFEPGTYLTTAAVVLASPEEQVSDATRARLLDAIAREPPFDRPSTLCGFAAPDCAAVIVPRRVVESVADSAEPFRRLLSSLQRELAELPLAVGIGTPVQTLAALPSSYQAALAAAGRLFYHGSGRVFFPRPWAAKRFAAPAELYGRFREALRDRDVAAAKEAVDHLRAEALSAECEDVDSVRNGFFNLLMALFDVAWERLIPDPFDRNESSYIWQEIRRKATLEETVRFVLSHLEELFGPEEGAQGLPRKVQEIQRYIRAHYPEPGLCLQSIADAIALSRTYLSALYRSRTGMTVSDAILRLRIERAKELLRCGTLRTYEVAQRVGYTNPGYFATVFRREVGCTPSEYRESPR